MTTKMGIRDITRNFSILDKYDYIEIEDKKTHKTKGLIVSDKYANEIKKILAKKIEEKKQKKLDEIMQFAGKLEIKERFRNLSDKEIRQKIAEEKYGNS